MILYLYHHIKGVKKVTDVTRRGHLMHLSERVSVAVFIEIAEIDNVINRLSGASLLGMIELEADDLIAVKRIKLLALLVNSVRCCTLGFIAPGEFIPLFEKNGFIMKLDQYMLSAVCSQQKKWMEEGRELVPISVNISRVHLMDPELVSDIVTTVDFYGVPHEYIELELTESAFFEDKQVLIDTIKQLQQAGFSVSMDDFGSGYSSLNSLKDLPLDVIKLDGEFFRESEDLERSNRIVKNTVELAQHLNMKIVAEGIEKQSQVQFLQEIGCDLIQGFYYAKPMEVTAFEELLYKKAEFVTNNMEMA